MVTFASSCTYTHIFVQVNKMDIGQAMKYKELYDKEEAKKGMGDAAYGKDQRVRATKYPAMKDDGRKRLHPARYCLKPFIIFVTIRQRGYDNN